MHVQQQNKCTFFTLADPKVPHTANAKVWKRFQFIRSHYTKLRLGYHTYIREWFV